MTDYFDLGDYSCPITCSSNAVQTWFDRGLIWCYGFNHEEGVRCFHKAIELDPNCAMAWWGLAYASGPFYNKPWEWFSDKERQDALEFCYASVSTALELAAKVTPVERAIITALSKRFQSPDESRFEVFGEWNEAYAVAMRSVYSAFPDNLEVITLTAEALMNLTPWRLWNVHTGDPAENAHTLEVIDILNRGLSRVEENGLSPHPGILHFYIHALEMSPNPENALDAANQLRFLVPESGHLLHMPSHIDLLCGHYEEAVAANNRAVAADASYLDLRGKNEFYMISCVHDHHLKMYSAMFAGQYKNAMEAADAIRGLLTEDIIRADRPYLANALEAYYAMRVHVQVRFGRWQDIVDEDFPEDIVAYSITHAMLHYAKGVSEAALGNVAASEPYKASLAEAIQLIPETHVIGNNNARDVFQVGTEMLNGELEYRKKNYDVAFAHLRNAAEIDDQLIYSEPWDWMHPPRHALGALLLEQDRVEEALNVYEADLGLINELPRCAQHPYNVWSLHGYVECLKQLNSSRYEPEAKRLELTLEKADIHIRASCCCRLEIKTR